MTYKYNTIDFPSFDFIKKSDITLVKSSELFTILSVIPISVPMKEGMFVGGQTNNSKDPLSSGTPLCFKICAATSIMWFCALENPVVSRSKTQYKQWPSCGSTTGSFCSVGWALRSVPWSSLGGCQWLLQIDVRVSVFLHCRATASALIPQTPHERFLFFVVLLHWYLCCDWKASGQWEHIDGSCVSMTTKTLVAASTMTQLKVVSNCT